MVHKVTSYVLVLSLLCSDKNEIDIGHIIDAVKTSRTALTKMYSVVAVRLRTGTTMLVFKLPSTIRAKSNFTRNKRKTM